MTDFYLCTGLKDSVARTAILKGYRKNSEEQTMNLVYQPLIRQPRETKAEAWRLQTTPIMPASNHRIASHYYLGVLPISVS
jgi:hypothetical protein